MHTHIQMFCTSDKKKLNKSCIGPLKTFTLLYMNILKMRRKKHLMGMIMQSKRRGLQLSGLSIDFYDEVLESTNHLCLSGNHMCSVEQVEIINTCTVCTNNTI